VNKLVSKAYRDAFIQIATVTSKIYAVYTLYCSPNIVRVIKWRKMRWAGHVARVGEERGCIGSRWGNRRERDHWGDPGVDG